MHPLKALTTAAAVLALAGTAQAALIDRGGGMVYDTTQNITWLADLNYAQTSGHTGVGVDVTGSMTWQAAKAWATGLNYGGYSDWRLPSLKADDASCSDSHDPGGGHPVQHSGYDCVGGELSHLFVVDLGNRGGESVDDQTGDTAEQIANRALFSNFAPWYWSLTAYAPTPGYAWAFMATNGSQNYFADWNGMFAVAVRRGDVDGNHVPEPASLALALLGLSATAIARRRKRAGHHAA